MDGTGRTGASPGHYELLLELAYGLSGSLDIGQVLKEALAATRRLVDFRGGSIALIEAGYLSIAVSEPAVGPEVAALRLPVGKGLSGRVAETGHSIYSKDLQNDVRVDVNVRMVVMLRHEYSYPLATQDGTRRCTWPGSTSRSSPTC